MCCPSGALTAGLPQTLSPLLPPAPSPEPPHRPGLRLTGRLPSPPTGRSPVLSLARLPDSEAGRGGGGLQRRDPQTKAAPCPVSPPGGHTGSAQVLYEDSRLVHLTAPYLPGFLAFREVPFLVDAVRRLREEEPSLAPQAGARGPACGGWPGASWRRRPARGRGEDLKAWASCPRPPGLAAPLTALPRGSSRSSWWMETGCSTPEVTLPPRGGGRAEGSGRLHHPLGAGNSSVSCWDPPESPFSSPHPPAPRPSGAAAELSRLSPWWPPAA